MIDTTKIISKRAESNINKIAEELKSQGKLEEYDLLVLLVKYMVDLYCFEVNNYPKNRSIPQIISRTIMETYFYVLYLTKSEGNKATYEIKKEAYNLIARRDEVKKLINALFNSQLINTNNPKDVIQRNKAIELAKKSDTQEGELERQKDNINDKIKEFFDNNSISISPKDFKDFYNVSKDTNGNYLHGLQNLAIYVNEGERYNLLMHQTSKRVHATNVYQEYDVSNMAPKNNPDDNIPIFISTLFVGNALKSITDFCNIKSLFDKNLGRYVDKLKHEIQIEHR
ncbi:hypothetical protein HCY00_09050 [Limosilactobacillus fermentum]|uniref:hypothetical protein n=1 Tax=Pediococcus pentosaceus TaxID=1255 RepID=UPI000B4AB51F|nr:hypothetical protein [Pediococcus pentosaceus]ASC09371.1 hypothetical protein S100194_01869 [Pediococcus pentosaceus]